METLNTSVIVDSVYSVRSEGHLSYGKSERPSVRQTVQMSELLNIARWAAGDLLSHL